MNSTHSMQRSRQRRMSRTKLSKQRLKHALVAAWLPFAALLALVLVLVLALVLVLVLVLPAHRSAPLAAPVDRAARICAAGA